MNRFISNITLGLALFQISCTLGEKPHQEQKRVIFSYEALAALQPRDIPAYVYVFPPLRSNKDGKPIETLTTVSSSSGAVVDWKTSSPQSMSLKAKIESRLSQIGYETVSFADLVSVKRPYSVVVISTFYTLPYDVKNDAGEITDRATLVLIKGALFDGNLDPKTKKDIIKVDGVTKIPVGRNLPDPVTHTVEQAFSWFADNSSGLMVTE
ncbi:MAG: hypothetical protein RL346_949 [Verrucomicrobiota bacterium]|jgi:hypothetical protein